LLDFFLVKIFANIAKCRIAEVAGVFALATDIIHVLERGSVTAPKGGRRFTYLASLLVGTNESIIAVNTRRDTRPDALAIVAVLDQTLAARKCIIHGLTFAFVENSWVTALPTGHWSVVFILSVSISETIADQDRLQVDVALLV